jgi:hypothetical protein
MQTLFALLIIVAISILIIGIADAMENHGFWLGTGIDNTSQSFRDFCKRKVVRGLAIGAAIVGALGLALTS